MAAARRVGPAPAAARRIARTGESGPFVIVQLDHGTTWTYGAPPRGRFWQWPPGPDKRALALVRALVAATEATDDPGRLVCWAALLAVGHATDPVTPDLLAWIARRQRQFAQPSVWSLGERARRAATSA